METDKIKLKVLLVSLASIVLMEAITSRIISKENFFLVQGAVRFADICVLVLIVVFIGDGLSSVGLARGDLLRGFKKGLIWSAAFGVLTAVSFLGLHLAGINPFKLIRANLPSKPGEIFFFLVVAALIAPIAEELLFRGILYGFFRRWGILNALVLSTIIFVGLHSVSGVPVTQAVGGIVFAIAYEIEKSLVVPITIHVLGNAAIFGISLIPNL